ncbi:hypothetical protein GCM10023195_57420 [Actinoallomurus liliacearum]|uniref:Gram-positive cocci surface proteins LPxTG domain-containing protein n=1 Tax=Actinoallomurus liliacearum TaxID=1080073 RepID=A0ABP8TPT3_9ACTN
MRTRTRLATTAGLTILGGTALSGVAQADTGGLDLTGGLTGPVSRTVGGALTKTTTQTSRTVRKATGVDLRVRVRLPGTPRAGTRPGRAAVRAGLGASLGGAHLKASLGLCAGCQAPNPAPQPPPTTPAPPNPPTSPNPPGSPPPGSTPPVARPPAVPPALGLPKGKGELMTIRSALPPLPYTGGPIGAMAFLGAIAVVTGAAAVIGARPKARLSA